jgi:4-diphosphocytidyl-2-C-methyl-D-erythritol kinase
MRLEIRSPAKINLQLNILGRRPDGFHELETLLHPVGLHDELTLEPAARGIALTCSDPTLPADPSNLVWRAAAAFLDAGGLRTGVRLHLEKRVPREAGLGGGSANAAATLRGLNQLFGYPLPAARLHELAAALGSDVPFFLQDKPALATGRGETIQPLDLFPALAGYWVLLVHPGFGISTAWAYQALARHPEARQGQPGRARELVRTLQSGDMALAAAQLYNSLEAPAFTKFPWLALARDFLAENSAPASRMSGSGSALFALTPTRDQAEALRERFRARFGPRLWTAVVPLGLDTQ